MFVKPLKMALLAGASLSALGSAALADSAASDQIQEVVVTAQRRTQNLQDVPISVNSFSGDFLEKTGAQTMGDLQQFTPGLSIDNTSVTQPNYSIRGISGSTFGIGTEPSVGIYVDGVYSARSGESLVFFDDVEHVEVLKGPQGTLFGRNTSAGAISITTNKPSDKYEAMIDIKGGNYDKREATAMVNIPLTDALDLRVDGIVNRRAGDIRNFVGGDKVGTEHNDSMHAALRWRPDNLTDVILSMDHDTTSQTPPTAIGVGPYANYTGNPFKGAYDDEMDGHESRNLNAYTLNASRDLGFATLTSLTAYRVFSTSNRESETGTADAAHYLDTENIEHNRNFYEELHLNGTAGPFTYFGGASYFHEHAEQGSVVTAMTDSIDTTIEAQGQSSVFGALAQYGIPSLGLPWTEAMNNRADNTAWSVFGDATYTVMPDLDVTAGLRFTDDSKKFQWVAPPVLIKGGSSVIVPGAISQNFGFPGDVDLQTFATTLFGMANGSTGGNLIFNTAPLPQGQAFNRSAEWTNLSPRFVVDYHWTPNLMSFVSASYGYKAGGFNSTAVNSYFQPEKVQNYEAGVKSDWLDHRLRVNGSAYYYRYTNQQSLNEVVVPGSLVPQYLTQTGDSEAKGVDAEIYVVPVHDLTLSVVGGYIDSTWTKDTLSEPTITGSSQSFDLSGQPTGEPEFRMVVGADYLYDMDKYGSLRFHADHSFTSAERTNTATRFEQSQLGYLVDFNAIPGYLQSRNLTNARVSWFDASGRLDVSLYANNVFNHHYVTDPGGEAAFALQSPVVRMADPPRFFGAELIYRY